MTDSWGSGLPFRWDPQSRDIGRTRELELARRGQIYPQVEKRSAGEPENSYREVRSTTYQRVDRTYTGFSEFLIRTTRQWAFRHPRCGQVVPADRANAALG